MTEPTRSLNKLAFERHPVWRFDDEREGKVPVEELDPVKYVDDPLMIKAQFRTPNGVELSGYIVGYELYYAFFVFANDRSFGFNETMQSDLIETREALAKALGEPNLSLFPLEYRTGLKHEDGSPIEGVLDFRNTE